MKGLVKRETRFTSKCPAKDIISKIEETAMPLGFDVKKNNYKVQKVAPLCFNQFYHSSIFLKINKKYIYICILWLGNNK